MLNANGARLLREARDRIVKFPEQFNWSNWCGTTCCIAGHCALIETSLAHQCWFPAKVVPNVDAIAMYCGFDRGGLDELFYGWNTTAEITEPGKAEAAINAFLWEFGYPPDELSETTSAPNDSRTIDAVATTVDEGKAAQFA